MSVFNEDNFSPLAWMRLHVEALFTQNEAGRLVRVNEPDGGPAPRVFLGRTPAGVEWWIRHDQDPGLLERLKDGSQIDGPVEINRPAPLSAALQTVLAEVAPTGRVWAGPAYRFPRQLPLSGETRLVDEHSAGLLHDLLDEWFGDVAHARPMAVTVVDERAVAICASVRITPQAHEAGVETHPAFRGQGFAGQAVARWATAVRAAGRIPLYSTSWENLASQAVAGKLGLIQFGADWHLT